MEDLPVQRFQLQTGCIDPNKCKCDLSATYEGSASFNQTVGKEQTHKLKFQIRNRGSEPGYNAMMKFWSSEIELPFPKFSSSNVLQCTEVMITTCRFFQIKQF